MFNNPYSLFSVGKKTNKKKTLSNVVKNKFKVDTFNSTNITTARNNLYASRLNTNIAKNNLYSSGKLKSSVNRSPFIATSKLTTNGSGVIKSVKGSTQTQKNPLFPLMPKVKEISTQTVDNIYKNQNNLSTNLVEKLSNVTNETPNNLQNTKNQTQIDELQKRLKTIEKSATDSQQLSNLSNSITELSTLVNSNTTKVNEVQSTLNANVANIDSLTTQVNTNQIKINEVNSTATTCLERLQNIEETNFQTLSTFDEITLTYKTLLYKKEYILPIYFLNSPCQVIKAIFDIEFKPFYTNTDSIFTIELNDEIVYTKPIAKQTQLEADLHIELYLYCDKPKNRINIYAQNGGNFFYHRKTKLKLEGINVAILNNKMPFNFNFGFNNQYLLTRTVENELEYQDNTMDNLDLENGWGSLENFTKTGNFHCLTWNYTINENGELEQNDYICVLNGLTGHFAYFYNCSTSHYRGISSDSKVFSCTSALKKPGVVSINYALFNKSNIFKKISFFDIPIVYGTLLDWQSKIANTEYVNNETPDMCFVYNKNVSTVNIPPLSAVIISDDGTALFSYRAINLSRITTIILDKGWQPFACFCENGFDVEVYLNYYGSIFKYYLTYSNETFEYTLTSKTFVCCADKLIHGFNNEYMVLRNGKVQFKIME